MRAGIGTNLAREALDEIAKEEAEETPPAIGQVWEEEIGRLRADLRGWLLEVVRQQHEWIPDAVELQFARNRTK